MDFDYVVAPALVLLFALLVIRTSARRMLSLSTTRYSSRRKVVERTILAFIVLLTALAGASSSFNAVVLYRVRAANPPQGAFYSVDGRKMHLNCTGSGSPTLVLEAGSGGDAFVWGGVQPVLSKTTRVCSYDRAGLGWSEPRSGPRDADHIARELHDLLLQAKVAGPLVLMGHSAGAIYLRDYLAHYPADVVGVVFVDGASPSASPKQTPKTSYYVGKLINQISRPIFILGIPRLLGICTRPKPGFEPAAGVLQREDLCHTKYGPVLSEFESREQSDRQIAQTGPYGALPVLIFSHDPSVRVWGKQIDDAWNNAQASLVKLSVRSRRIIAKDSGHYVQFDRSDLIESEVSQFIEQIRGAVPQPADYGTTIIK
jgi:pimeloyl-ACP methyl ester carboxylesterase